MLNDTGSVYNMIVFITYNSPMFQFFLNYDKNVYYQYTGSSKTYDSKTVSRMI